MKEKQTKREQISDRVCWARNKHVVADIFPSLKVHTFSGFLLLLPKKTAEIVTDRFKFWKTWKHEGKKKSHQEKPLSNILMILYISTSCWNLVTRRFKEWMDKNRIVMMPSNIDTAHTNTRMRGFLALLLSLVFHSVYCT